MGAEVTKRDDELIERHSSHGWVVAAAMSTIRRVPRADTEQIMACPCGWYGWVSRQSLLSSSLSALTSPDNKEAPRG